MESRYLTRLYYLHDSVACPQGDLPWSSIEVLSLRSQVNLPDLENDTLTYIHAYNYVRNYNKKTRIRAPAATFDGILIGSVVMTEILVCSFDAVPGPGTSVVAQSSTEMP